MTIPAAISSADTPLLSPFLVFPRTQRSFFNYRCDVRVRPLRRPAAAACHGKCLCLREGGLQEETEAHVWRQTGGWRESFVHEGSIHGESRSRGPRRTVWGLATRCLPLKWGRTPTFATRKDKKSHGDQGTLSFEQTSHSQRTPLAIRTPIPDKNSPRTRIIREGWDPWRKKCFGSQTLIPEDQLSGQSR